jgi:hypothetical protein
LLKLATTPHSLVERGSSGIDANLNVLDSRSGVHLVDLWRKELAVSGEPQCRVGVFFVNSGNHSEVAGDVEENFAITEEIDFESAPHGRNHALK